MHSRCQGIYEFVVFFQLSLQTIVVFIKCLNKMMLTNRKKIYLTQNNAMSIVCSPILLRNAVVGGRLSDFAWKRRYGYVRLNIISVTRGWVGVKCPEKMRYVTLEWPLYCM